jgi:hypothetical protein
MRASSTKSGCEVYYYITVTLSLNSACITPPFNVYAPRKEGGADSAGTTFLTGGGLDNIIVPICIEFPFISSKSQDFGVYATVVERIALEQLVKKRKKSNKKKYIRRR